MERIFKLMCGVLLIATASMAGPTSDTVVLIGGKTLTGVKAEVQEGMVWVDFGNGRRQAFEPDDVDFEASGLLPDTAVVEPEPRSTRPGIGSGSVFSTDERVRDTAETGLLITDADVEHVEPVIEEELVDHGDKLLIIGNLRKKSIGTSLRVTGMVTNRSNAPAGEVTINVTALAKNGTSLGQGSADLRSALPAGGVAPFSIVIEGGATAASLHAWADASLPEGAVIATTDPSPLREGKARGVPVGRGGKEH